MASSAHSIHLPRGYRGPRRLAIAGFLTFVPACALALGLATTVLASSATSFVGDLARPAVNLVLEAAGQERIDESASDVSLLLVLTFIGSIVLAALGACALVLSFLWSIARLQPRRRVVAGYRRVRPASSAPALPAAPPPALVAAPDSMTPGTAADEREVIRVGNTGT